MKVLLLLKVISVMRNVGKYSETNKHIYNGDVVQIQTR